MCINNIGYRITIFQVLRVEESFKILGVLKVSNKIRIYKIPFLKIKRHILSKHDISTTKEKSLQINASIRTFCSKRENLSLKLAILIWNAPEMYFPELLHQPLSKISKSFLVIALSDKWHYLVSSYQIDSFNNFHFIGKLFSFYLFLSFIHVYHFL